MDLKKNVREFMEDCVGNAFSRYRSYDFCHKAFCDKRSCRDEETVKCLALHLYAFLGSWGMICRGNTLMQNNYTWLCKAVEVVCDKKCDALVDADIFAEEFDKASYVEKLIELYAELKATLFPQSDKSRHETMITKIMMATLGCVVAYDSHVKDALRRSGLCGTFGRQSLLDLLEFADKHKDQLLAIQKEYEGKTIAPYSIMKYIDCALWKEV